MDPFANASPAEWASWNASDALGRASEARVDAQRAYEKIVALEIRVKELEALTHDMCIRITELQGK